MAWAGTLILLGLAYTSCLVWRPSPGLVWRPRQTLIIPSFARFRYSPGLVWRPSQLGSAFLSHFVWCPSLAWFGVLAKPYYSNICSVSYPSRLVWRPRQTIPNAYTIPNLAIALCEHTSQAARYNFDHSSQKSGTCLVALPF